MVKVRVNDANAAVVQRLAGDDTKSAGNLNEAFESRSNDRVLIDARDAVQSVKISEFTELDDGFHGHGWMLSK
jgi:hypothetical protein